MKAEPILENLMIAITMMAMLDKFPLEPFEYLIGVSTVLTKAAGVSEDHPDVLYLNKLALASLFGNHDTMMKLANERALRGVEENS